MNENDIKLFYDLTASDTAKEWYDNEMLLPTIKEWMELLPEHPKVLDLGCGTGHESKRLYKQGAEVVGVDFSKEAIKIARYKCKECLFIESDFLNLQDSSEKYDGIFSAGSLIHMPLQELFIAVRTVSQYLKKGGKFLAILQEGGEKFIHYPEINGKKIERVLYRFTKEEILDCFKQSKLFFIRSPYLSEELTTSNWQAYVFSKE